MLAIVAPLATELTGIRRAIREPSSRGVTLSVVGVGKSATVAGLADIVAASPRALIMVGFCGGADPALRTGDIHVADSFHNAADPQSAPIPAEPGLVSAIASAAGPAAIRVATGPSATVASVAGPVVKSAVRASAGAASVNMEDYWAARAARNAGVPFASVRSVLDPADAELPAWITARAGHPSAIALGLVAHPERCVALLRLARQAHVARGSLTRCVLAAIETLAAPEPSLSAVPS